jgi:hypothetical protein
MTYERTADFALVRAIRTDPALYRYGTDDFAPPREQFQPWEHPNVWYVIVREDVPNGFDANAGATAGSTVKGATDMRCAWGAKFSLSERSGPSASSTTT